MIETVRTDIEIEHPAQTRHRSLLCNVLVDTGAELSWIPAEVLEALRITLLGARSLEGRITSIWRDRAAS
jgi:hypothetical protein